jgi:hypothetical protein
MWVTITITEGLFANNDKDLGVAYWGTISVTGSIFSSANPGSYLARLSINGTLLLTWHHSR